MMETEPILGSETQEYASTSARVRFNSTPEYEKPRERRASRRSNSSNEPTFMSPLSFEEIDVKNTPLSSLRSCSEYQRQQIEVQLNTLKNSKTIPKSFWSRLFRSPSRQTSFDEQAFLIEKMRFNPAMLYEGEEYHYHPAQDLESAAAYTCFSFNLVGNDPLTGQPLRTASSEENRLLRESAFAFDYLFGIKLGDSSLPMEIELKSLSEPKYFTPIYSEDLRRGFYNEATSNDEENTTENGLGLRRTPSIRSVASETTIDNSQIFFEQEHLNAVMEAPLDGTTYRILIKDIINRQRLRIITNLRNLFPPSRGDDLFYESIRLQPFASGAYLRCMLLAGLSSTFFQIYNVFSWPHEVTELRIESSFFRYFEMFLFVNLLIQIFLNILQLPFRLHIHFMCWESSRSLEVDAAITMIRRMLESESWLLNKALGKTIDALIVLNLALTDIYLWCSSREDPLRNLMISLSATNMLTIVARVLVATIFSFSMHDPYVLSEARRRGLSKWDLAVLPTFLFSKPEEVNNSDCPICLCGFEMGEMLISLPCDAKHSFHANCIRQWLQRQNSCPLCNKLV